MTARNPFAALGLHARPDLTDDQVRDAWRPIAAATHPDRADGGDPAPTPPPAPPTRSLRTPWGRSEAYADLAARTIPADVAASPGRPARLAGAAAGRGCTCPARIRHGRPRRLAVRIAGRRPARRRRRCTPGPAPPPSPRCLTGIGTWLALTGRADLAPPPGR